MTQTIRGFDRSIAVAFIMFVALGLPGGLLGVAWPSMRTEFALRQDALGMFLFANVTGFVLTSSTSGKLTDYLDIGRLLILASILRSGAALAILVAPSWASVIALGFIMSLGTGWIDAGVNAYVAQYGNTRLMNWLHAAFGIGATISPIVMTALLNFDLSWRWGYVFVGAAQIGMIFLIFYTLASWQQVELETGAPAPAQTSMRSILKLPVVWVSIALFILVAGLEASAGDWSFTLFTEGRGINEELAGIVIGGYWASFTLGRVIFGIVGERWHTTTVKRLLAALIIGGAMLVAANISHALTFFGLLLTGFALAPLFPLLIQDTAARMTHQEANYVIGLQLAAAGTGVAILPGMVGVLAERVSLEAISLSLVGIGAGLFLIHELVTWMAARQSLHQKAATAGVLSQGD